MTLRLSVNRSGFDMNSGELRDAITDLTRLAGDIGEAVAMMMAGAAMPPGEARDRAAALRKHRAWLLEQAELLRAKLRLHEDRARELVIRKSVESLTVTLVMQPAHTEAEAGARRRR